ncbi:MAG: hypothetical protein QXL98_03845 [Thermofilaceae archaeon]
MSLKWMIGGLWQYFNIGRVVEVLVKCVCLLDSPSFIFTYARASFTLTL